MRATEQLIEPDASITNLSSLFSPVKLKDARSRRVYLGVGRLLVTLVRLKIENAFV
jgi:hypothetical protein